MNKYPNLENINYVDDVIYLGYNEKGQLSDINTQSGEMLHYNYDGFLLKSENISGLNAFEIAYDYNDDFNLSQIKLTDNSENYDINLSYDNDGLLTELNINNNNLTIIRDLLNGLIKAVESGNIKENKLYNEYGEISENKVVFNNNEIDKTNYQYNLNGKVIVKTEKENGIFKTKKYEYNSRSQIEYMKDENNEIIERFAYDSNGNRFVCESISGNCSVSINAIYDKEDKLINWGDKTFTYNQNGQLQSCSGQSCAVNQYFYDNFGNLRKAILKNGDEIEYIIDGKNRITGKKVNNVVTKKYVYKDLLNPIAELDENNNIQTIFIYGSDKESPDLIYKPNNPVNNQLFRVVKDNIGSVKKVISQNGEIVQEINYDTFGKVIFNTSPDFQPFGFAGGIYDNHTKLVRFGARDYDSETGRWTAKDPIGFKGGDTNLYGYVLQDPVNLRDVNGKKFWSTVVACGSVIGWTGGLILGTIGADILLKANHFKETYAYQIGTDLGNALADIFYESDIDSRLSEIEYNRRAKRSEEKLKKHLGLE